MYPTDRGCCLLTITSNKQTAPFQTTSSSIINALFLRAYLILGHNSGVRDYPNAKSTNKRTTRINNSNEKNNERSSCSHSLRSGTAVIFLIAFSLAAQGMGQIAPIPSEVAGWGTNWVRLDPNETNLGLFKIIFSTFWRGAPKCTETDLKKSQICTIWWPNLTPL